MMEHRLWLNIFEIGLRDKMKTVYEVKNDLLLLVLV